MKHRAKQCPLLQIYTGQSESSMVFTWKVVMFLVGLEHWVVEQKWNGPPFQVPIFENLDCNFFSLPLPLSLARSLFHQHFLHPAPTAYSSIFKIEYFVQVRKLICAYSPYQKYCAFPICITLEYSIFRSKEEILNLPFPPI